MAQQVNVVLVDDMDGSEASETVVFSLDGTNYEIDLSDAHAKKLRDSLESFINAGRKVGGGRGRPRGTGTSSSGSSSNGGGRASRNDLNEIREWARANGHTVSERGRIKGEVIAAYDAAH